MKYQEITKLTEEDLQAKLQENEELLQKLKLTHTINPIPKPTRINHTRKLIARIKTAQNIQNHSK